MSAVDHFPFVPALRGKASLRDLLVFAFWAFLFALIYAQSPLYTSNQNQYFLHGLAQAGYGNLKEDWLASTADPTPVFSLLVQLTYTVFRDGWPFYLYYAFLLGIYLYSLVGVVFEVNQQLSPTAKLLFVTSFLGIHSAAFRYLITLTAGPEWSFILEGGLADQRVLGQVFQPSTFGVFLILAISLFLKGKISQAILVAAIAATFHPTYLLSNAFLFASFILANYLGEKRLINTGRYGMFALLCTAPILAYVLLNFQSDRAPEAVERSRELLVSYRLPHHALVTEWFDLTSLFQLILIMIAVILFRRTKLARLILFVLFPAMLLSIIQWMTGNATLALLFPWRISVILVPLSAAVISGRILVRLDDTHQGWLESRPKEIAVLSVTAIVVLCILGGVRFVLELGQQPLPSERALFDSISKSRQHSQVYLIPIKMQDFRLATGEPAYVDFKSIPYRSEDVLEWYRRIQVAEEFYRRGFRSCNSFEQLVSHEGITGVILKQGVKPADCPGWKRIYEDEFYQVMVYED